MLNPWTMKMEQFTAFSDMEKRRLDELICRKQIDYAPKDDIIADREHSASCHVVLSGLACRYKLLPDGRRQIMAFLIPGDLCDAEIFVLKVMDHGVAAITPTTAALVPGDDMRALLRETSSLGEALWWGTMSASCVNASSMKAGATPMCAPPTSCTRCWCASAWWS